MLQQQQQEAGMHSHLSNMLLVHVAAPADIAVTALTPS